MSFVSSPIPDLFSVNGLVAVVTGGGTGQYQIAVLRVVGINFGIVIGIGLMIATALEHNGATVYIAARRLDVLEKAARENNVSSRSIAILV